MKSLENLEEFHCEKSSQLSIATANLLINNCDNLKAISDLQNWSELDPSYLGNLMERYDTKYDLIKNTSHASHVNMFSIIHIFYSRVHSQNIDLDMRGNYRIRKYLEMRNFERKTYINFLTGPSIERMRRAAQRQPVVNNPGV